MTTTIFAANGARLPVYITRYKKEYDLLFRGTLYECTEFCADRQSAEATRAAYARMAA